MLYGRLCPCGCRPRFTRPTLARRHPARRLRPHELDLQGVKPGTHSVMVAIKKLVEAAVLDQRNERFVLVGNSTGARTGCLWPAWQPLACVLQVQLRLVLLQLGPMAPLAGLQVSHGGVLATTATQALPPPCSASVPPRHVLPATDEREQVAGGRLHTRCGCCSCELVGCLRMAVAACSHRVPCHPCSFR